jgi:hypothetical protein
MKLKIKPTLPKSSSTELVRKGEFPSRDNQFKPGASWKGNAGGRPKIIGQTLEQRLLEEIESDIPDPKDPKKKIKVRRLDLVVDSLIRNATTDLPHSVSAFRAIRETLEPADQQPTDRDNFSVAREVLLLMIERGKHMEVKDI